MSLGDLTNWAKQSGTDASQNMMALLKNDASYGDDGLLKDNSGLHEVTPMGRRRGSAPHPDPTGGANLPGYDPTHESYGGGLLSDTTSDYEKPKEGPSMAQQILGGKISPVASGYQGVTAPDMSRYADLNAYSKFLTPVQRAARARAAIQMPGNKYMQSLLGG
jgi:hypothetical protein